MTEPKSVKCELKGARLKNAAAEVGSNIVEGIGAMIGTNREEKARHEQAELQLQAKLDRIEHWLPDTQTLLSRGEYCRDMGISESGAREIITMKPLTSRASLCLG